MAKNSPVVTGISPAEGPPGTKVKIRGENLGKSAADLLAVFICKVNCTFTAEWSPHFITCRTGAGLGIGSIVVVTKAGGEGTSTVQFRGYMPRVGLLTESAVWVDESKLFEEKPSTGLSVSRPLSPNFSENDPLGVAPSETGAVIPPDKIDEMYPKNSGNILQENFHPARFLLERHLDTSFDALKSGFYHLESQDTRSLSGPVSLVRSNLGTILESLDILGDIQLAVADDKEESIGGSITQELEGTLSNCNMVANAMFKDIISRKDDADAKRNALNVLQRFKFLFNLQRNIEKNIQQGDYEIVISDYNRAKALFQNSEVKSFRKALEKVDNQIYEFMVQLKEKLFDFPSVLEEQRRLIRYLTDLDCPGDPAWDCIVNLQQWIKKLFMECKEFYLKSEVKSSLSPPSSAFDVRVARADNRLGATTDLPGKHRRTPSDGTRANYLKTAKRSQNRPTSTRSLFPPSIMPQTPSDATVPNGIQFIEELCELIVGNLPDLWQLGKAYLSNEIGNKVNAPGESQLDIPKYTKKFSDMIQEVIQLFCNLVYGVMRPSALSGMTEIQRAKIRGWSKEDSDVIYFPSCGRQISTANETLKSLGLPTDSVDLLKSLSSSICDQCIRETLRITHERIKELEKTENWNLTYDELNTCISSLPMNFEKIVTDSIVFISNFMADTKLDDEEQSSKMRKYVIESVKKYIETFLSCLQKIADREEEFDAKNERSTRQQKDAGSTHAVDMSLDKKYLVCLSNCNYLEASVLPRIAEKCKKYGFEELSEMATVFSDKINGFDNSIFEKYIECRGDPLVGSIEQGMLLGEYRWEDNVDLKGVRPYLREVIMSLVVIHDQVSAISTNFVKRIFQKIGSMLADEVQRIFECYSNFSDKGALQAYLEISVFEGCLKYNLTKEAQDTLRKARKIVPQLTDDKLSDVKNIIVDFNKEMFFQLSCFWPPEEVQSFAETHGLMSQIDEKRSRSIGKKPGEPPKKMRAPQTIPKYQKEQNVTSMVAPPKIADKAAEQPSAANRNEDEGLKRSNRVLSRKTPGATFSDVRNKKESSNPFEEDSSEPNNPFLDDKNPFLDEEDPVQDKAPSNPFLEDEPPNPFADGDEDNGESSNPFLD